MSDEETPKRGKFPFLEIYLETVDFLDPASGMAVLHGIIEFGLYQIEPDFSETPNPDACNMAWFHVKNYLVRGWQMSETNRKNGQKGGARKGNQNARRTTENKRDTTENKRETTNKRKKESKQEIE